MMGETHKSWITEKAHRAWSNHLFLLNNHQRDAAGSRIKGKQTNILLHVVHREAVQLPTATGCTYRTFPRAPSPSPGPRCDQSHLGGQPEQETGREGWPSPCPHQHWKWIHTGIVHSLAWRHHWFSTTQQHKEARKWAPKSGCDGKSEDQPQGGCDWLQGCHSDGRQRTCSSRCGLEPQSHIYYMEPDLEWSRKGISKAERGESNPILSNLNSLCSFIMLSQETGNFQAVLSQWGLSDTVTEPWFNRVLINFMHFKSGKRRASLWKQGLHAALR